MAVSARSLHTPVDADRCKGSRYVVKAICKRAMGTVIEGFRTVIFNPIHPQRNTLSTGDLSFLDQ
jgi:hypothetical protein